MTSQDSHLEGGLSNKKARACYSYFTLMELLLLFAAIFCISPFQKVLFNYLETFTCLLKMKCYQKTLPSLVPSLNEDFASPGRLFIHAIKREIMLEDFAKPCLLVI